MSVLTIALLALAVALLTVVSPLVALWVRRRIARIDRQEALREAIEEHGGADRSQPELRQAEVRQERAMLRSILDLGQVTVGEVMTHRKHLVAIDVAQPAARILDEVLSSPYTRLPLWRNAPDEIVGVLHAKDLLRAIRAAGGAAAGIDIDRIATEPWFVPDTTTLSEQLEAFKRRREHFALVVDEYGSLQGVVTLEDILEEIVGDIADEHDQQFAGLYAQADGSFVVDGTVTIRDLNRELDWTLPSETAVTIAGLVLHEARQIPEVGQVFSFFEYRFEILQRQRNQIMQLRVTPPRSGADVEADEAMLRGG